MPLIKPDQIAGVFECALSLWDTITGTTLIVALIPRLDDDQIQRTLSKLLAMEWDQNCSEILTSLVPRMDRAQVENVLQFALASNYQEIPVRLLLGLALESRLQEKQRGMLLSFSLDLVLTGHRTVSPSQLASIADSGALVCQLDSGVLAGAINQYLWDAGPTLSRSWLLDLLDEQMIFQPEVFEESTLAAMAQSIVDVCWLWHWR